MFCLYGLFTKRYKSLIPRLGSSWKTLLFLLQRSMQTWKETSPRHGTKNVTVATLLKQTSPRHWHKNRPFWQHTFDDVPWSLHGLSIGVALLPLDKKNHSPLDFCNLRIVGGWGCRWWRCCWNKSMPSFTVNSSDKCYQQKCSHFSSGSSCLSTLKIT